MINEIQVLINSTLLREIDGYKLIRTYARYCYNSEEDIENDVLIQQNLAQILDWDINGDEGLALYCGKFESIKHRDLLKLIQFIKDNKYEIKKQSTKWINERRLENVKKIYAAKELQDSINKEKFSRVDYSVSGRGRKNKECTYEGRHYKSRLECCYKEGITKAQLYKYLVETNQIDSKSPIAQKYKKNYEKNNNS